VRNFGLMGEVEIEPRPDAPGTRGMEMHKKCFWEEDLVIRNGGDVLQFSPFLNSRPEDMTMTFEKIRKVLDSID
jgi:beta-alanine--pyruvate transaminase